MNDDSQTEMVTMPLCEASWLRTILTNLHLASRAVLMGATALASVAASDPASAQAPQQQRPNILFIMGDDIGWFNIGAYHQGIMSGKTPNLDRLASEGMRFTDYYAEASCTAGRANFITGELPIRTGLTTVGQAGADVGLPAQAPTIAAALKAMGYTTGQFGKNHLGDLNKYLPCVHGFDEFFGYLYHLDAMSDPYWYSYPRIQLSETLSVPATLFIAGRAIRTIKPSSRAGVQSESKRSSTKGHSPQVPTPDARPMAGRAREFAMPNTT